jgi:L-amino acid N-acyltransferase YncA
MPQSSRSQTARIPVHIRQAEPSDFEGFSRIYAKYVWNDPYTFELVPPSSNDMLRRFQKVSERNLPWLTAEYNGIIGYAYADEYHERAAARFTVENSVYIEASCTDQGVGTALMKELINRVTDLGYRQMVARIGDAGNIASKRLHFRLGFEECGVLKNIGLKNGKWIDLYYMQLALGEGCETVPSNQDRPEGYCPSVRLN